MKLVLPRNRSGFTLVEMLIAVVIGGILTTVGLAAYRGAGDRQKVKQAGVSFQTNLNSYRQKAVAGEKPAACTGSDTLLSYRVRYLTQNSYGVKAICQTANPAETSVELPDGISFAANFTLTFTVLTGETGASQTITLQQDSRRYQVVVEPTGVIRGEML